MSDRVICATKHRESRSIVCGEQNALAKSNGKPCDSSLRCPFMSALWRQEWCLQHTHGTQDSSNLVLFRHPTYFCSQFIHWGFTPGLGLSCNMHTATAHAHGSFAFQPRFKLFHATFPIWSRTIFSIMFAIYFICRKNWTFSKPTTQFILLLVSQHQKKKRQYANTSQTKWKCNLWIDILEYLC